MSLPTVAQLQQLSQLKGTYGLPTTGSLFTNNYVDSTIYSVVNISDGTRNDDQSRRNNMPFVCVAN